MSVWRTRIVAQGQEAGVTSKNVDSASGKAQQRRYALAEEDAADED